MDSNSWYNYNRISLVQILLYEKKPFKKDDDLDKILNEHEHKSEEENFED